MNRCFITTLFDKMHKNAIIHLNYPRILELEPLEIAKVGQSPQPYGLSLYGAWFIGRLETMVARATA